MPYDDFHLDYPDPLFLPRRRRLGTNYLGETVLPDADPLAYLSPPPLSTYEPAPVPSYQPELPPPAAPEPGLLDRALETITYPLTLPKRGVDALARKVAELEGIPQPEGATTGQMLRAAAGLSAAENEAEAPDSYARALGGRALEFGGDIASDPLTYILGGVPGTRFAGGVGKIAQEGATAAAALRSGMLVPEAAAAAAPLVDPGLQAAKVGRAAAAAFAPGMISSAVHEGARALHDYEDQGLTPQVAEEALGTGLSAGMGAMTAAHALHPTAGFETSYQEIAKRGQMPMEEAITRDIVAQKRRNAGGGEVAPGGVAASNVWWGDTPPGMEGPPGMPGAAPPQPGGPGAPSMDALGQWLEQMKDQGLHFAPNEAGTAYRLTNIPKLDLEVHPTGEITVNADALRAGHGGKAAEGVEAGTYDVGGQYVPLGPGRARIDIKNLPELLHEVHGHVYLEHFAPPEHRSFIERAFKDAADASGRSWDEEFSDAIKEWMEGRREVKGPVLELFMRIRDFYERLKMGLGITSLEGIYREIESGRAYEREAGPGAWPEGVPVPAEGARAPEASAPDTYQGEGMPAGFGVEPTLPALSPADVMADSLRSRGVPSIWDRSPEGLPDTWQAGVPSGFGEVTPEQPRPTAPNVYEGEAVEPIEMQPLRSPEEVRRDMIESQLFDPNRQAEADQELLNQVLEQRSARDAEVKAKAEAAAKVEAEARAKAEAEAAAKAKAEAVAAEAKAKAEAEAAARTGYNALTPEGQATVHGTALSWAQGIAENERSEPTGRRRNAAGEWYGVKSKKHGTPFADLPYQPGQMLKALEKAAATGKPGKIARLLYDAVLRHDQDLVEHLEKKGESWGAAKAAEPETMTYREMHAIDPEAASNVADAFVEGGGELKHPDDPLPVEMFNFERKRLGREPYVNRRTDAARRSEIDELIRNTPIDKLAENHPETYDLIYVDPLTGLENRRAYERRIKDHKGPVISFDLAGLGYVNDKLGGGHGLGDAFLRVFAGVAKNYPGLRIMRAGLRSDEFFGLADTNEIARAGSREIQDRFANATFDGLRDGKPVSFTGGRVDYGIAETESAPTAIERVPISDAELYRNREEARLQGLRASEKGHRPPGLREIPRSGDVENYAPTDQETLTEPGGTPPPGAPFPKLSVRPKAEAKAEEPEPAPTFFSQLRRTIDDKRMPVAAKGADYLRFIQDPKRGVRKEEIQWTGLDKFLKERAGERVTKQELQDFVDRNEVRVEEKVEGGPISSERWSVVEQAFDDRQEELIGQLIDGEGMSVADANQTIEALRFNEPTDLAPGGSEPSEKTLEMADRYREAVRDWDRMTRDREDSTQYGQYTLPGGKNYRELLLTLPEDKPPSLGTPTTAKPSEEYGGYEVFNEHGDPYGVYYANSEADALKLAKRRGPTDFGLSRQPKPKEAFEGSHFPGVKNLLAWVRFKDRTDSQGKKTLFVEEIQSDWAQQGRREGFAGELTPEEAELQGYERQLLDRNAPDLTPEQNARLEELQRQGVTQSLKRKRQGLPPGPFVGETNDWSSLAMKRMIRWAADHGYDRIAWTTGEQQAARYNLANQVENLEVFGRTDARTGERTRSVSFALRNGHDMHLGIDQDGVVDNVTGGPANLKGRHLDELVGEELSNKIMNADLPARFDGEDIKVGGEGMRGYYDQILPQIANRLGKKWGAKVGETEIGTEEGWDGKPGEPMPEAGLQVGRERGAIQKVHAIDIPQEMSREVREKGFPRFSVKKKARAEEEPYRPELTAFHNLTADDLTKADRLGGLPMPSIAVTRGRVQEGYGPITLVGRREMIDPEADPRNKVYPADAYTGRVPRTEHKANLKKIDKLLETFPRKEFVEIGDEGRDKLAKGPDDALWYAKNSNSFRAAFLRERGIEAKPLERDVPLLQGELSRDPQIAAWVKEHPEARNMRPGDPAWAEFSQVVRPAIERAAKGWGKLGQKRVESAFDEETGQLHFGIGDRIIEDVGKIGRREHDRYGTRDAINAEIEKRGLEPEFERWVADKLEPVYEGEFIRVGRKRLPVTLENLLDAMNAKAGAEDTMTFGPGKARAMGARPIRSVQEMRNRREKIVPAEDFRTWQKEQEVRHKEMADSLLGQHEYSGAFEQLDSMYRAVARVLRRLDFRRAAMSSALRSEGFKGELGGGVDAALDVAKGLLEAPTEYFEAKPERGVGLEEFAGAIIPHDTPQNVKDILARRGVETREYPAGDNEARQRMADEMTTAKKVKFSAKPKEEEPGEPGPVFFSQLRRVVDDKRMPGAAKGADYLRFVQDPKRGVKADEIKWTGLDDFLKERAGIRVTKQEIQDFLAQNETKVEEVTLGDRGDDGQVKPTRFGRDSLQIPGGKKYRELLLTLPEYRDPAAEQRVAEAEKNYQQQRDALMEANEQYKDDKIGRAEIDRVQEQFDAAQQELASARYGQRSEQDRRTYRAGHYPDPNVLAHVRFNERTDADGKKTLFLEEVQSDWGEQGRKHGFRDEKPHEVMELPDNYEVRKGFDGYSVYRTRENGPNLLVTSGHDTAEAAKDFVLAELNEAGRAGSSDQPLKGPFVGDTKSWSSLAMKRMIRWAAEHGYDRIAWTKGDQQSERYNLARHISGIDYERRGDNSYDVFAADRDGRNAVFDEQGIPISRVEEVFGKDVAEKVERNAVLGQGKRLHGLDLKVGGEGMRGFYDEILPSVANKLGKKFGAKVGETTIYGGDAEGGTYANPKSVHSLDITPEMRRSVVQEGQPLYSVKRKAGARPEPAGGEEPESRRGPKYSTAAYHGSPHDFDKFDSEKIGTGEGAQAYGWGLYFAGKKDVADYYRENLSKGDWTYKGEPVKLGTGQYLLAQALERVRPKDKTPEAIKLAIDNEIHGLRSHAEFARKLYGDDTAAMYEHRADRLEALDPNELTYRKGRMYEVELAPDEHEYLDWDKPLSEQSEKVKRALATLGIEQRAADDTPAPGWGNIGADAINPTGRALYENLARDMGRKTRDAEKLPQWVRDTVPDRMIPDDKAASLALREAGIPGIRFLDQGSRIDPGEAPSHNYVIFDDSHVTVKSKYAARRRAADPNEFAQRSREKEQDRLGMPRDLADDLNLISDERAHNEAIRTPGTTVTRDGGFSGGATSGEVVRSQEFRERGPLGPQSVRKTLVRHDYDGQPVERWYPEDEISPEAPRRPKYATAPSMPSDVGEASERIERERPEPIEEPEGMGRPMRPGEAPRVEAKVDELKRVAPGVKLSRDAPRTWESIDPEARKTLARVTQTPEHEASFYQKVATGRLNDVEVQAMDALRAGKIEAEGRLRQKLARAVAEGRDTGPENIEYLKAALDRVTADLAVAAKSDVEAGTKLARALAARARVMKAQISATTPDALLRKLFREIPDISEKNAADLVTIFRERPQDIGSALHGVLDPTWKDKVLEAWKAGLVSAPGTQVANILGNIGEQIMRVGETGTSALVDKFLGGNRTRLGGEARQEVGGALKGASRALGNLGRDLKDALTLQPEKIDLRKNLEHQVGAIGGKGGRAVRIPFRLLSAFDNFFKEVGGEAELYKRAYRRAGGNMEEFNRLIERDSEGNLKNAPQDILDEVAAARQERTFQSPNEMAQAIVNMRSRNKLLHVILPFVNTPANIARLTWQRSPAGFFEGYKAWDAWRQATREGKPAAEVARLRGEAMDKLARPLLGTTMIAAFAAYAKAGGMTGSGPTDPKDQNALKDAGWQPYSFVVAGPGGKKTYIPFNRFEPVSSLLGFAADLAEAPDEKTGNDLFAKAIGSVAQNLTSKTYLQGIADAAEVVKDPQGAGGRYVASLAGSLVPNIVAKGAQAIDPTFRETKPRETGLAGLPERIGKTIASRIPGLSQTLPEKVSGMGKPIERPGTAVTRFLSPIQPTVEGADADFQKALVKIDAVPSPAKRTIVVKGRQVPLEDDEFTLIVKADQKTTDKLRDLVASAQFRNLEQEAQRTVVRNAYERGRADARNTILRSATFRRRASDLIRASRSAS